MNLRTPQERIDALKFGFIGSQIEKIYNRVNGNKVVMGNVGRTT